MNSQSSSILKKYGLPTTEILDLSNLASYKEETQDDAFVYVRYSSESKQQYGFTNVVLHINALIKDLVKYKNHVEEGFIVSVERKYTTLLGGATLYSNGYTYTEVVKGHSVTLLRRGLCGARIVLHEDGNKTIKKQFQRFLAEQNQSYLYLPTAGPTDADIAMVVSEIGKYIKFGEPGLLIEWMLTEESGFLCCDAKVGFTQFGTQLYKLSRSASIDVFDGGRTNIDYERVIVGGFDCDISEPLVDFNYLLEVSNEALLSHAITRAILGGNCYVVLKESGI